MKIKPFHCKLDGCNKRFTELGNLKVSDASTPREKGGNAN